LKWNPFRRYGGKRTDSVVDASLTRALEAEGCPVCRLTREGEEWVLWGMLYELSGDPEVHQRFRTSLGLCSRHAALLARLVAKRDLITPSAVARLYEGLSYHVRRELERGIPEGDCGLCEYARDRAQRYAEALARFLEAPEARELYRRSAGLCLPHLRAVLVSARPEVRELLLKDFARRLENLEEKLRELQRKQSYDVTEGVTPEESRAWREALWRFGGMEFDSLLTGER